MFVTFLCATLLVALAAPQAAASIWIGTPTLTQCNTVELKWSGGKGPYKLHVVPTSDPCVDSVVNIPQQSGTSYQWKVNIPAGSSVEVMVEDSTLDEGWTGAMTVANSNDASCVDSNAAKALGISVPTSSTPPAGSSGAAGSPGAAGSAATPVSPQAIPTYQPVSPLANTGNKTTTAGKVNSAPRAALPAGSLLAVFAFLLTAQFL